MKKTLKLCERNMMVWSIGTEEEIRIHKACKMVDIGRRMYYYNPTKVDEEVLSKLTDLAGNYPARVCRKINLKLLCKRNRLIM